MRYPIPLIIAGVIAALVVTIYITTSISTAPFATSGNQTFTLAPGQVATWYTTGGHVSLTANTTTSVILYNQPYVALPAFYFPNATLMTDLNNTAFTIAGAKFYVAIHGGYLYVAWLNGPSSNGIVPAYKMAQVDNSSLYYPVSAYGDTFISSFANAVSANYSVTPAFYNGTVVESNCTAMLTFLTTSGTSMTMGYTGSSVSVSTTTTTINAYKTAEATVTVGSTQVPVDLEWTTLIGICPTTPVSISISVHA